MSKPFSIFIDRFSWVGFIRLFFYPLTTILTTPVRLVQTLLNCRMLAKGRWDDYNHFTPFNGINSLYCWTIALNFSKFGRAGHSPSMGFGNYPLTRCFSYSLISLYPYWKASTITLLLGMFGWLLSHLIWLNHLALPLLLLIVFLAVISTTFYANIFALQNYNVLGWFFFPLGLYGIFSGNWIIAAIAWFLISLSSSTIVFIASILSIVVSIESQTLAPIGTLLPAGLKLLTHFYPFLILGKIKTSLLNMMKNIGMYHRGVKYRKFPTYFQKRKIARSVYFLLLYLQFFIISYLITGKFSVVFLTGIVIFILNSSFVRFADRQSMQMLMFSLATAVILKNFNLRLIPSYWLLISPLPLLVPFPFMSKVLDIVPKLAPFSVKKLKEDMSSFLEPVKSGERVLMAFADPNNISGNIFDGYRSLVELAFYISSEKGINFIPDWWAIAEFNYQGAPDFWGRDVDSVLKNIKQWKSDYVVVYQNAGTDLDEKWMTAGFQVSTKFSWADYKQELSAGRPYYGETTEWWLLKIPGNVNG